MIASSPDPGLINFGSDILYVYNAVRLASVE
jgi:hypothetical protein